MNTISLSYCEQIKFTHLIILAKSVVGQALVSLDSWSPPTAMVLFAVRADLKSSLATHWPSQAEMCMKLLAFWSRMCLAERCRLCKTQHNTLCSHGLHPVFIKIIGDETEQQQQKQNLVIFYFLLFETRTLFICTYTCACKYTILFKLVFSNVGVIS